MKTGNVTKAILITTAIFGIAVLAAAQGSVWGGKGLISTTSKGKINSGNSITITYRVTDSKGTGTAGFNCEVTNPDGTIHKASKVSTEWSCGEAKASFTYPDDFSASQVPCTTQTTGKYEIRCYWYIEGYGVDGAIAAASSRFKVQ